MVDPTNIIPDYLVIGHIAHDITPHGPQIGGTVSYAAHTAVAFGLRVGILTSSAPDEPLLSFLPSEAHIVSVPAEHTTTFENRYDNSSRTQYLYHRARTLHADMVPPKWREARLVHLAPIAYETHPDLITAFDNKPICMTPQGMMRQREDDGRIKTIHWDSAAQVLPHTSLLVLSEEDIRHDPSLEQKFAALAPVMVLTRAERGCTVYENGVPTDYPARDDVEQVEPTGAGDIFAAALHIAYQRTGQLERAIRVATWLGGQSVTRRGMAGTPTPDEAAWAMSQLTSALDPS